MEKKGGLKKKRRINSKLKKAVFTTLSMVFFMSAIIVAAIPVQEMRANTSTLLVTATGDNIPTVSPTDHIFTTGDGMFQFAFINRPNSSDKIAVIVGYVASRSLENNTLVIPDVVNGYVKLTDTQGTDLGYVASSQDHTPLYYAIYEEVQVPTGNVIYTDIKDEDGNVTGTVSENEMKTESQIKGYQPCYYTAEYRANWENLESDEFFYCTNPTEVIPENRNYTRTMTDDKKWVKAAEVAYISSQHVNGSNGEWTLVDDSNTAVADRKGVFSDAANIRILVTGDKLLGIGDNAFKGCSSLNGIELSNGANTIGNYAFANCINLTYIDIDLYSSIRTIGNNAFSSCRALKSFTLPIAVEQIGDYAFSGCSAMKEVNLTSENYNVNLQKLGRGVFQNCAALTELYFPASFEQDIADDENGLSRGELDINLVSGCTSLKSITVPNANLNFVENSSGTFKFQQFKEQVGTAFYFASLGVSNLHDTATKQSIAFKYLDGDYLYEKIVTYDNGKQIIYRVDENNNLRYFKMDEGIEDVAIPNTIGPYKIVNIASDSFQNNCSLKKITIPSSILKIGDYAFQGCHNLKDVIFEKPINLESIGTGAFNTQVTGPNCSHTLDKVPYLSFTGEISPTSVPFTYAMDPNSNINRGSQEKTYITFFSGWPTNLTVKYNPSLDLNELVAYPLYTEIANGTIDYPDTTADHRLAASTAVADFEAYNLGDSSRQPTQDQWDVINSALNIVLPAGIEGVAAGIFSGLDEKGNAVSSVSGNGVSGPNSYLQSIVTHDVKNIPAYAFYGCPNLQSVIMSTDGIGEEKIGNYAFGDCDNLTDVNISSNVQSLGLRPFKDCQKLTNVLFNGGPYFTCDNGIIFGLTDGAKSSVVECLETRGATGPYSIGPSMVRKTELEGIKSIADEAFMDCLGIGAVDLSLSKITEVPVSCFENTTNLFAVELSETTRSIRERAFKNSGVRSLVIPESVTYIDTTSMTNADGAINKNITIACAEGSAAETFALLYGLTIGDRLEKKFSVIFFDWDDTILSSQSVVKGDDAIPPANPVRKGYSFDKWKPDYTSVSRDLSIYAIYDKTEADINATKFTVTFYDWDDTIIAQQVVSEGEDAYTPTAPTREGYTFTGWRHDYTNVQSNLDVYAMYEKIDSQAVTYNVIFYNYDDNIVSHQKVTPGASAVTPVSPTREGYTFKGWKPSYENVTRDLDVFAQFEKNEATTDTGDGDSNNNGDDSNDDNSNNNNGNNNNGNNNNGSGSDNTTTETFVVNVINGTGSGSYVPGSTVTINALTLPSQTFSNWVANATDFTISDVTATSATFTMPKHAVIVEAKYITKSTTSGRAGTSTTSGNSVGKNGTVNNGTKIEVNKSGISDKDKASASVSGSSDDFVVKITDDENARSLVEQALLTEYGNLDAIRYMAMDISLYDKTGNTKIVDTTGLSVTITIPIPDALRTYAGNNKAASVLSGRLDKLSPKFTTIDGTPCISFVATHFSPYTVYVDTANLTAGTTIDSTPSTGDGLHPKWFLSIGFFVISILLFAKRGTKKKIIVSV